jgi:hypothetical protein
MNIYRFLRDTVYNAPLCTIKLLKGRHTHPTNSYFLLKIPIFEVKNHEF